MLISNTDEEEGMVIADHQSPASYTLITRQLNRFAPA
jgi:hypothetical protein